MTRSPPQCPIAPERLRATGDALEQARGLPPEAFTDAAVFDYERQTLFALGWQCVARAEEVAEPGSCMTSPLTPAGLLLVRDAEGSLRAFHNVCPHRGARILGAACRERSSLQCQYHGWRFGLDGSLHSAPHTAGLTEFSPEDNGLRPVRLEVWQGFVFANLDGAAPPLLQWLDDLPAHCARWELDGLRHGRTQRYEVAANWKLLCENFAEAEHFPWVHPALERLTPARLAESVAARGPWQGGTMELAAGVETVSGDGARHGRPFLRGTRAQERLVHDFLVWPTLLFSVQPDYLLTYRLYPQDARRTLVVASIHFAADAFPGQACFAPEVYDFWTRANAEDQEICEQQQLGVESAGWRPGRFTRVEDGVHRFAQFVVRAYGGKAP